MDEPDVLDQARLLLDLRSAPVTYKTLARFAGVDVRAAQRALATFVSPGQGTQGKPPRTVAWVVFLKRSNDTRVTLIFEKTDATAQVSRLAHRSSHEQQLYELELHGWVASSHTAYAASASQPCLDSSMLCAADVLAEIKMVAAPKREPNSLRTGQLCSVRDHIAMATRFSVQPTDPCPVGLMSAYRPPTETTVPVEAEQSFAVAEGNASNVLPPPNPTMLQTETRPQTNLARRPTKQKPPSRKQQKRSKQRLSDRNQKKLRDFFS